MTNQADSKGKAVIHIIITDDHPLIIQGLERILSRYPHIRVTAVCSNAEELMAALKSSRTDVLLLDIQLPDRTGDELAPEILKQYPDLKIIVLTNFEGTVYVSKMLWQGVHGYLLKTSGEDTLIEAIETVMNGGKFIEQQVRNKMDTEPIRSPKMLTEKLSLTTREKEILQLLVEGFTDKEISGKIFLGTSTIKWYRLNLLLKLDAKNVAEMVSIALKSGLAR